MVVAANKVVKLSRFNPLKNVQDGKCFEMADPNDWVKCWSIISQERFIKISHALNVTHYYSKAA